LRSFQNVGKALTREVEENLCLPHLLWRDPFLFNKAESQGSCDDKRKKEYYLMKNRVVILLGKQERLRGKGEVVYLEKSQSLLARRFPTLP